MLNEEHTEIGHAVIALADAPTPENQQAFFRAFLSGKVCFRVPKELGAVSSGEYTTKPEIDLRIPTMTLDNGEKMLLTLANAIWLHNNEPRTTFIELAGLDVLRIARDNNAGVIVQVLGPKREGWSGISTTDTSRLMLASEGKLTPATLRNSRRDRRG